MRILKFILLLVLAYGSSQIHAQAILQVPSAGFPTVQSALTAAQSGDTVEVLPGTYFENLVLADKDVTLRAQVRGTVTIDGGALATTLIVERSTGCVIDGLHLTNGVGGVLPLTTSTSTYGGGIWLRGRDPVSYFSTSTALLVKFCRIEGNQAEYGAAIFGDVFGTLTIEDCEITNNQGTQSAGVYATQSPLTLRRTMVSGNGPGHGGTRISNGKTILTDCIFRNCPFAAFSSGTALVTRCTFDSNDLVMGGGLSSSISLGHEFYDCLMIGNGTATGALANMKFYRGAIVQNCTIIGNTNNPTLPVIQAVDWAQITVDNCIIRDNGCPDFGTIQPDPNHPFNQVVPPAAVTASYCCLSQQDYSGPGNTDLDPLFVDPLFGDYRLSPGSPCVDTGAAALRSNATTDLLGRNRVLINEIDMGCYEAAGLAHHPASAGRVGELAGGPYDILLINGSSGGITRTVTASIGSSSTVALVDPPTSLANRNFVIFGLLDEATAETVVTLPFGIGDMMFAPTPLVPAFLHWLFFVYTDNFNPGSAQFLNSTPTPWNSGFGPAIPFPLRLTLQAVIEESPGVFVPSNAVVLRVE